MGFRVLMP
ncbi:Protein of unknown function [Leuconostoc citreum]|nr:Protein of unknown function [Leuconostoc citreum]